MIRYMSGQNKRNVRQNAT